jgi:hypothetical protein
MGWANVLAGYEKVNFWWELPPFQEILSTVASKFDGGRGIWAKKWRLMKFIYVMVDKGQRAVLG